MIDFLFFLFDTATDLCGVHKDDHESAWKRAGYKIGGSAVTLLGILLMLPNTVLTYVLGGILMFAGFVLVSVGDKLLITQEDSES